MSLQRLQDDGAEFLAGYTCYKENKENIKQLQNKTVDKNIISYIIILIWIVISVFIGINFIISGLLW